METEERKNTGCYESCLEIMERETGILDRIAPVQEALTRAVIRREWGDFDASVSSLMDLSGSFEELEAERERLFANMPGAERVGGEARFYTIISRLPGPQRRELSQRYRELKQKSLSLRIANNGLVEYLNEAKAAVGAFLEAALPSRSGPAYSRQGTRVPQDMRSMVLNHSL